MKFRTSLLLALNLVPMALDAGAQVAIDHQSAQDQTVLELAEEAVAQRRYEQLKPRVEATIDPKILDEYTGYYQIVPGQIISITQDGGHLIYKTLPGGATIEFVAENDYDFFVKDGRLQVSFVNSGGKAADLLILRAAGYDRAAKRIDEATATAFLKGLELRIANDIAVPGSEIALRRHIKALEQGKPLYDEMGPIVARRTRDRLPYMQKELASLGELRSLAFKSVGRAGEDVYEARFSGGAVECRIVLAPDGKIRGLNYRLLP
jgi:hypothetical protein